VTDQAQGMGDVVVGPWRRRTRRVAYQNPWLTLYHDDVVRPDGRPGIYGVVHFANLAVGVVALDGEDHVALVGQHRYTLDLFSWEIPEGGVGRDEDPLAGAQRELREETGATAATWRELCRVHISNSVTDESAILYVATALEHGAQQLDGTEHDLTVRWIPLAEVLTMVDDGRITDAMSVVALQRLALERLAGR
jgi:8-oxo-dGTP pyrophosphatase MutT (NUDIX family)